MPRIASVWGTNPNRFNPEFVISPPGSAVEGKPIAAWGGDLQNWKAKFTAAQGSPWGDPNGSQATAHQDGPIWFIAGSPANRDV